MKKNNSSRKQQNNKKKKKTYKKKKNLRNKTHKRKKNTKNTMKWIQRGGHPPTPEEFSLAIQNIIVEILNFQGRLAKNMDVPKNKEGLSKKKKELLDYIDSFEVNTSDDNILNTVIPTLLPINGKPTKISTYLLYLILYNIKDDVSVEMLLKKLKEKGADFNVFNWHDETPIYGEISGKVMGSPRNNYILLLIECGSDPNEFSKTTFPGEIMLITPLILLLLEKKIPEDMYYSIMITLLSSGADVNLKGQSLTETTKTISPLTICISLNPSPHNVQLLIKYGVNTNELIEMIHNKKKTYYHAIDIALKTSRFEIADIIMNAPQTDINMVYHIENDDFTLLTLIISISSLRGKDYKTTPGMEVNKEKHFENYKTNLRFFLKRLMDKPSFDIINVSPKITTPKYTPLMMAISDEYVDIELIKIMIESPKIDINKPDDEGNTALIVAILSGNKEILQMILDVPSLNINMKNNKEQTALSIACENNYPDMVSIILKKPGVDKNVSTKKKLPANIKKMLDDYNPLTVDAKTLYAADEEARRNEQLLLDMLSKESASQTTTTSKKKGAPKTVPVVAEKAVAEKVPVPVPVPVAAEKETAKKVAAEKAALEKAAAEKADAEAKQREATKNAKIAADMEKKRIKKEEVRKKQEEEERAAQEEEERLNLQIYEIKEFWLPRMEKITGSTRKAIDELIAIKNIITSEGICEKLKRLIQHFDVYSAYVAYKKEMCILGYLMCIITKILDDSGTCILLLKGGKAIQVEMPIPTNDFDYYIIPKPEETDVVNNFKIYAYEVSNFLSWAIKGNKINFNLSSVAFNKEAGGRRSMITLSGDEVSKTRFMSSPVDVDSIVKVSIVKRDGSGFLAALDIGYGYDATVKTSPLILQIYKAGQLKKEIPDDNLRLFYVKLDALLEERLYYYILYTKNPELGKQNIFFLQKLPSSLLIILLEISKNLHQSIEFVLRYYFERVYSALFPLVQTLDPNYLNAYNEEKEYMFHYIFASLHH